MRSRLTRLLVAMALLGLTGCGAVPHPFAPDAKPSLAGVLEIDPRAGLVVGQVEGLPAPAREDAFRALLAEALQARDFTASTAPGHRLSHRLHGELRRDGDLVRGRWLLLRSDGSVAGRADSAVVAPGPAGASQAWLQRLAEAAADAVNDAVKAGEAESGRRLALPAVALGPIDGAPGDGRTALATALAKALSDAEVPLLPEPAEGGYLLLGSVHMQPLPGQRQRVEILWQLIRPDGREIGQVSQANAVPAGLLDGAWGKLAEDVVAAGAPAIVALLRRSGELPAGSGDGGGNSGGNGDDSE